MEEIASCPSCRYPIKITHAGQTALCANCGTKMEAAISEGITIPNWLLTGAIAFTLGALLGPSLVASTQSGKSWLERQARGG